MSHRFVVLSSQAFDDFCEARRGAQLATLRRRKAARAGQEGRTGKAKNVFDDFDFSKVVLMNPEALDVGEDDEL